MIASSSKDGKVIIWKIYLDYDYSNEHFDNITIQCSKMFTYDHFATNKSSRNEVNLIFLFYQNINLRS